MARINLKLMRQLAAEKVQERGGTFREIASRNDIYIQFFDEAGKPFGYLAGAGRGVAFWDTGFPPEEYGRFGKPVPLDQMAPYDNPFKNLDIPALMAAA